MTNERAQTELAERCEKATGPDFKIDCEIERLIFDNHQGMMRSFTASLDAAMTLVPEEAATDWSLIGGTRWQAEVADELADAATPALALCAAALRARSQ
jgi:hypothetical protein